MIYTIGRPKTIDPALEQFATLGNQLLLLGRHTGYSGGEVFETAADAQRALERQWSPGLRHLRAVYEVDGEWYRDTYAVVEGDYCLKHDRPIIGRYFGQEATNI